VLPLGIEGSVGVGAGSVGGVMTQEGQNVFQVGQVLVSRTRDSTSAGAAGILVLLMMVKFPPGP